MSDDMAVMVSELQLADRPQQRAEWLDFVARCFAAKGTPREYFEGQLIRDAAAGHNQTKTIFVARSQATGEIVSTAKIFYRRIGLQRSPDHDHDGTGDNHSCDSTIATMAGIGAVCTDPSYRGRGLSTKILNYINACVINSDTGIQPGVPGVQYAREQFRVFIEAALDKDIGSFCHEYSPEVHGAHWELIDK